MRPPSLGIMWVSPEGGGRGSPTGGCGVAAGCLALLGAGSSSLLLSFSKPPLCGFAVGVPLRSLFPVCVPGVGSGACGSLTYPRSLAATAPATAALFGVVSVPEVMLALLRFGHSWPTGVVAVPSGLWGLW